MNTVFAFSQVFCIGLLLVFLFARLWFETFQYVEVASALKDNMLLGGNLPDSLSQYMYHGHDGEYDDDEEDSGYEEDYEDLDDKEEAEQQRDKVEDRHRKSI